MKVNIENTTTTPRIYVAPLSDYNSGRLHGRWIDADRGAQHIWDEIAAILKDLKEPIAEEWAIHDYEGFGPIRLGESEPIEMVADLAELIAEHGEVFAALVDHFGGACGIDEAKQYMTEGYQGCYQSVVHYAEQFMEDCYGDVLSKLPDIIKYHIDYEGIAHDFECSGDIFTLDIGREVHVFSGNI